MQDRIDEAAPESIQQQGTTPEDELPPKLTKCRLFFLCLARIGMFLAISFIVVICFLIFWHPDAVPECICWPYLALAVFLTGLMSDFIIRHKILVHKKRKEDRSEIEALIQEARYVRPRLTNPERPAGFAAKREQIEKEVKRLEDNVGPKGWTEFQVLTLDRMLIDFLPLEDLKARARSSLDELKEYAYGEAFTYEDDSYRNWENKIKSNIGRLDELDKDDASAEEKDDIAEALRANLRAVREHVADYQANWGEGSTIVSGIRICGAAATVVFTLMGILPLVYPTQHCSLLCDLHLGILNWGFLGMAGAIAIALVSLRNAKEVEVANTAGKQELWRVFLSAPLGLLAGVLAFSTIAGGLINSGSAVPNLTEPEFSDAYLSIAWAVVAGMGFEGVFQRARDAVES